MSTPLNTATGTGMATTVKTFFDKAFSTLTRRRPMFETAAEEVDGQELSVVVPKERPASNEYDSSTPSPVLSPVEPIGTIEADDILFRKNNVCLKHPRKKKTSMSSSLPRSRDVSFSSSLSESGDSFSSRDSTPSRSLSHDGQELIPGFLFITTRGSDFGTTLILNWAPNSSIVSQQRAPPEIGRGSRSSSLTDENGRFTTVEDCPSVSIDLGLMEVIRVFYRISEDGLVASGEMVITSKERKFKVFHFKNGGLNDLIHLFRSWKFFKHHCHKESYQHTFTIFRPKLSLSELHPSEGSVKSVLTEEMWRDLLDHNGRIVDSNYVRKVIFFQGISPALRKEVWPFLLGLYTFQSTSAERDAIRAKRREEYLDLDKRRRENERCGVYVKGVSHSADSSDRDGRPAVYHQIEKDVIRTDRSTSYYKGEDNAHCNVLMDIILNYLLYKPDIRYCQGMTDLLAPLLAALDDEPEAFWCFTELVQSSAFYKPGKDHISISHQIEPLRLLIEKLIPSFYSYLERIEGGTSLMFCHRWLLVCLKREFQEEDALTIWEACWSNYQSKSFHLFICVAIMAMYGQKAVDKNMHINELMVFFNTLSCSMPRDIVLSQARGYLNQFCSNSEVSCVLYPLMTEEFWSFKDSPKLSCSVCKGLGSCSRTGFVSDYEAVC